MLGMSPAERERLANLHSLYARCVGAALHFRGLSGPDVDDLVQDVFMTAARRLSEIKEGSERAFLVSVALNKASAFHRTSLHLARDKGVDPTKLEAHQDDDALYVRELLLACALTPWQRDALALEVFGGLTHEEIAEQLETKIGTVKSRLWSAKREIEDMLRHQPSSSAAISSREEFPHEKRR
jgi:RNA polymerase sigma factor (sigma-70 family)